MPCAGPQLRRPRLERPVGPGPAFASLPPGYAETMTDSHAPENEPETGNGPASSREGAGEHTIPIDQEQPGGGPSTPEDDAQEENAETSLDQPSQ